MRGTLGCLILCELGANEAPLSSQQLAARRGTLGCLILCELDANEALLSGQQLAARMAARRGTDPSPGTLHPALRRLREAGCSTRPPLDAATSGSTASRPTAWRGRLSPHLVPPGLR